MLSYRAVVICFISLASLFVFPQNTLAQWGGEGGWGMGPGMMGWGILGWFGPIMMVIFWFLLYAG